MLLFDGTVNEAGDVELKNSQDKKHHPVFISTDAATPWFKALAPVESNKSQFLSYGVSNSVQADLQPTDVRTVYDNLVAHFDKKIELGLLTPERAKEVLAMALDPAAQEVFTDESGELNTHLFASTLATAGTVLDGAMEVFLGDNDTGMPAKVFYSTEFSSSNFDAEVFQTANGEMEVHVSPGAKFVPFEITATILGHEALHQDKKITQNEEIIASTAQSVAYAQQLLVKPELATNNLFSAHFNNTWLLTLINSGKAGFPNPGLEKAPTLQRELGLGDQALPDGSSALACRNIMLKF